MQSAWQLNCQQNPTEKEFTQKGHLMKHVRSVHEGLTIKRDKRLKTSENNDGLRKHVQSVNEGRRFECPQCSTTFATRNALRRHVQSI